MRVTLSKSEAKALIQLIEANKEATLLISGDIELLEAKEKLEAELSKGTKATKRNATHQATKAKRAISDKKAFKAIESLRANNEKLTVTNLAKRAGLSYNTAKRYKEAMLDDEFRD